MKKWLKYSIIGGSIFIGACAIGTIAVIGVSAGILAKPIIDLVTPAKDVLSIERVTRNFEKGGIWENKKFLTADDFNGYTKIWNDAFNDASIPKLEYIELPSDITLYNYSIYWPNVNEIRVKDVSRATNNLFIENNILFAYSEKQYWALTIANRSITSELIFPCYKSTKQEYKSIDVAYSIVDNFYHSDIFKNITSIRFYDTTTNDNPDAYYALLSIGSFVNCDKFSKNLKIYNATGCTIKSFINSNIEDFSYIAVNDENAYYLGNSNLRGQILFLGKIHGTSFKSFTYQNLTSAIFNVAIFNNYSGFITSLASFDFNFISKTGWLFIVNQKTALNEQSISSDLSSFLHRTNQLYKLEIGYNIFDPINFDNLNIKIFLNTANYDGIMYSMPWFLTYYEYIKYLGYGLDQTFQYDITIKLLEPTINGEQGFSFIINFDKEMLKDQISTNYYDLIQIQSYNFD